MNNDKSVAAVAKEEQFKNIEIKREGEQIIIPPKMTLKQARIWLERKEVEEEQEIAIDERKSVV